MQLYDAGDLPAHREAVRLELRRGRTKPLAAYLRHCARNRDGRIDPALAKAIAETEFSMHHPSLKGAGVRRFNRRASVITDRLRELLTCLQGDVGTDYCYLLADLLDGVSNGEPILQLKVVVPRRKQGAQRTGTLDDDRLIALFLLSRASAGNRPWEQRHVLTTAMLQDAISRFGCSRATVFRVWKRHRTSFGIGCLVGWDVH